MYITIKTNCVEVSVTIILKSPKSIALSVMVDLPLLSQKIGIIMFSSKIARFSFLYLISFLSLCQVKKNSIGMNKTIFLLFSKILLVSVMCPSNHKSSHLKMLNFSLQYFKALLVLHIKMYALVHKYLILLSLY